MPKQFMLTKKERKPNDIVQLRCLYTAGSYPKLGLKFRNGLAAMAWGKIESLYKDPNTTQQFQSEWMKSFGPIDEFKGMPPRATLITVKRVGSTSEQLISDAVAERAGDEQPEMPGLLDAAVTAAVGDQQVAKPSPPKRRAGGVGDMSTGGQLKAE